jgi:hypothetical protein
MTPSGPAGSLLNVCNGDHCPPLPSRNPASMTPAGWLNWSSTTWLTMAFRPHRSRDLGLTRRQSLLGMISDKSYRPAQTFRVNQLGLDFGFRRFDRLLQTVRQFALPGFRFAAIHRFWFPLPQTKKATQRPPLSWMMNRRWARFGQAASWCGVASQAATALV